MSQLDVDVLMTDPDFVDEITQIRRTPLVTSQGKNILNEKRTRVVGSVQPASGDVLARIPEALRNARVYSFWIKGTITSTSPGEYSDILVFKGLRYEVQTVDNWSNWGEGYCQGTCVAAVPA